MIASVLRELVERLDDPDPARRRIAAETLGALGPRAAPVLADVVDRSIVDPEPRVRYGLLVALERIGWQPLDWIATFAALCEHPDEVAQARAAWALGRIGPDAAEAIPALIAVARDARRIVDPRWSAVGALERMGLAARTAVPHLRALLRDDADPDMREAAARALGATADEDTTSALRDALSDGDHLVRESAAGAVAALAAADDDTLTALAPLTADDWPTVRASAHDALARLGRAQRPAAAPEPSATHAATVRARLDELLERLATGDERTRQISTFEVGKLGPEAAGAVPLLIGLYETSGNLDVRYSAAFGFGRMGAPAAAAIPALLRGLAYDEDSDVRSTTVWALARLHPDAGAWQAAVVDGLASALDDGDSLVREETCRALAGLGAAAARARNTLARCAGDEHPLVRARAREALAAADA